MLALNCFWQHQMQHLLLCWHAEPTLPCKSGPQESVLFLALAGQHQIWKVDLSNNNAAQVFSGDGSERNANATTGAKTSWAQPSGLSLSQNGEEVWVADSESSCVRSMSAVSGAGKVWVMSSHCGNGSQIWPDAPDLT